MSGTLAQKILAQASGRENVRAGEFVTARIDLAITRELISDAWAMGLRRVWDPERVVVVLDHEAPAPSLEIAESYKQARERVKALGIKHFYAEGCGVCHQVVIDQGFVLPGKLIVATDSHTTMYGALGAAGTGIGTSEMAYVLATGKLWFKVPQTIKFELRGNLQKGVSAKDVILFVAGKYSSSAAQYKSIEFSGPAASDLSLSSRLTMSNMAMEIGAKFAFFSPDEQVESYLKGRARFPYEMLQPDPDAVYEKVIEIVLDGLEPQIAFPYSVDNVKPISQVGEIKIEQAVLGSCTNGRLEDLVLAAEMVKGRKVSKDTRFLVLPASDEVYREGLKNGALAALVEAGAVICNPGCGPCYGACMGLLAAGEACVASINRNFKGRMGSPDSRVYLASPQTVAASALAGKIVDPRDL
jgi:3-isopropylmalate/(R)-2-methylmalate dehydratase large subunit